MADRRDPRQEPRNPGWRVWGEEYPPVPVRAANADGRTFNGIARRPPGYVLDQSLNQPDGRHGYNPDLRDHVVQPPRFPSPHGPARLLDYDERLEVFEPPLRDFGTVQGPRALQRLNERADHFLRGTPGPRAPMPQLRQRSRSSDRQPMSRYRRSESPNRWFESPFRRPRSPISHRLELVSEGDRTRYHTPCRPYTPARREDPLPSPSPRRSLGRNQRGDARGYTGGGSRRYGGD